jgi:hypothetical protein
MIWLQDALFAALSSLRSLQTLRIALPSPFSSDRSDTFRPDPEEKNLAAILAARLPDLYEIAFQSLHRAGPGDSGDLYIAWEVYNIIRDGPNVIVEWEDPSR